MFEIDIDKVVAVLTDNTNVNKAAWKILKKKYQEKHISYYGC